jgi:peptidoglycan/LPS O-acetylase OafA/YrhL
MSPDSHHAPGPSSSTWALLGYMRLILALIVAAGHLEDAYGRYNGLDAVLIHGLSGLNGAAAVLGFLIISGFSIAHSIRTTPEHYVWRRFVRIYPLFLLAVVFSVVWPAQTGAGKGLPEASSLTDIIGQLLMLDGIVTHSSMGNRVLWTLGLEWWCYMAAPFLIELKSRWLGWLMVGSAILHLSWVVLGSRLGGYYAIPCGGAKIWFLGVFWIAGFWYYLNRNRATSGVLLFSLIWILTGLNRDNLGRNYQLTLASTCMLLATSNHVRLPVMLQRWSSLCGNLSYSVYLFHVPVFRFLVEVSHLTSASVILAVTCVVCWLAHVFIELPSRRALALGFKWWQANSSRGGG